MGEPDPDAEPEISVERLRSGARTLGITLTHMARSMEAARIEMLQSGPAAAMEWILQALPDVSDEEPGDQWDGRESAAEWLDRTDSAEADPAPLRVPDDMILVHRGLVLTVTGTLPAFLPDPAAYTGPVDLGDFLEASDELRAAAGAAVTGE